MALPRSIAVRKSSLLPDQEPYICLETLRLTLGLCILCCVDVTLEDWQWHTKPNPHFSIIWDCHHRSGICACMSVVYCWLIGIDGGDDVSRDILVGIYDRTSTTPFKPAADHVTQVMKVEQMIVGKKPVSHFIFCSIFLDNVCSSSSNDNEHVLQCLLTGRLHDAQIS